MGVHICLLRLLQTLFHWRMNVFILCMWLQITFSFILLSSFVDLFYCAVVLLSAMRISILLNSSLLNSRSYYSSCSFHNTHVSFLFALWVWLYDKTAHGCRTDWWLRFSDTCSFSSTITQQQFLCSFLFQSRSWADCIPKFECDILKKMRLRLTDYWKISIHFHTVVASPPWGHIK